MSARGINRRALLSGAAAAVAFSALPLQWPPSADARRSSDRQIAYRRYRALRGLLRSNAPVATAITKLLQPATKPGGYLQLRVTHPKRSAWLSFADAQEPIPLEPIQVIAPISIEPGLISEGSIGSPYGQQYYQILMLLVAQQRAYQAALAAQQAALVNVMVVSPPEPEPTIIPPVVEPEPEPALPPSFNDPLFNNPYSQYVASALRDVGLEITEAMAVAFLIEGAATALEFALPPVYATASQLIAEGLAAGTIAARLGLFATGLTVSLTGAGLALASLAVVGITLYYVVPEIERARRSTISDFTGEVSVEATPVAEPPVVSAEPELIPYIPDGAPISQEESETLYPGYDWYWDVQTQAWVYFGG